MMGRRTKLSKKGKLKGDIYIAAVQYNLSGGDRELHNEVSRRIDRAFRGGIPRDAVEYQLKKASKDATDILEYLNSIPGELPAGGPGSIKLTRMGWSIVGSGPMNAVW